ncbi:MAG: M28 family peptidase [Candidatus Thorarchaeota archaeon]|jgi:hypothetical protein
MSRRTLAALALLVVVVTSATLGYFLFIQPGPIDDETTLEIIPDPLNDLNWWDIAWSLRDYGDFFTPLTIITSIGNRYNDVPDSGYYDAAEYVTDLLDSFGITSRFVEPHDAILAHQDGYGTDNRAIVFGAHLDTEPYGVGVRNNAGGASVVAMIASILSEFRLPVDIYYCFFSWNTVRSDPMSDDTWMYGSNEIAAEMVADEVDVIACYNFDDLLFYRPTDPPAMRFVAEHEVVDSLGYHQTKYAADLLVTALNAAGLNVITAIEETNTQGDHWAFWDEGYPAINVRSGHIIDPENVPPDTIQSNGHDIATPEYLARSAAAAAVYLALQGNGEVTSMKLAGSLEPGESRSLRTIMTHPQNIAFHGTTSGDQLTISVRNGPTTYLEPTLISQTNISLTTERVVPVGPVMMRVTNDGNETVDIELYMDYESDTDGNGVMDSSQYTWPDPDPPLDWDGDGLGDKGEIEAGTDIFVRDTDMDTIYDGLEVLYGMDPLRDDSEEDLDDDGLTNLREVQIGTYPNTMDTDGDSMDDLWEVLYKTDPLVDDSHLDPDSDGLTNLEEYTHGADPFSMDGDFDGLSDSEEVDLGTNPLSDDSDGDGLRDQLEIIEGLNPLTPDYDVDLAPDGPDHNPRVNTLLVISLITVVPVAIGTLLFWRRLR